MSTSTSAPAACPVPDASPAPARRGLLIAAAVVLGLLVAAVWSAPFVDDVIGEAVAGAVVGYEVHGADSAVASGAAGLLFALAAGLGGTFCACNITAFGALAPMLAAGAPARSRVAVVARPLGWLAVGALPVAGLYGALGAVIGEQLPQLSTAVIGGVPARLLHAMVVYGIVGLVLVVMGLAALRLIPDPLGRLTARHPATPLVVFGILIGLFLVGRPYPLFRAWFAAAAADGNPWFGAVSFLVIAVANLALVAVVFVAIALFGGRALQRALSDGRRVAAITGTVLLAAGVFNLAYWVVRLAARHGYGWYPVAPWV